MSAHDDPWLREALRRTSPRTSYLPPEVRIAALEQQVNDLLRTAQLQLARLDDYRARIDVLQGRLDAAEAQLEMLKSRQV